MSVESSQVTVGLTPAILAFKTKLGTGEVLYGVASGGTTNIHVLKQDVG